MGCEMCIGGMVWRIGEVVELYEQIAWFQNHNFRGLSFHTAPLFATRAASFDVRKTSSDDRRRLKEALVSFDEISVHAEFANYDVRLSSPNELIRHASVESLAGSIKLAGELGAPVVTVHKGSSSVAAPGEVLREAFARSLAELAVMAAESGVIIGFENEPFVEPDYDLILQADGPVGITLDTGHLCFDDGAGYREFGTVGNLIRYLGDRVVHVHVHDYDGVHDHLAVGAGRIDFADVLGGLRDISYAGMLCLELNPDYTTPQDYVKSRAALRRLLGGRS